MAILEFLRNWVKDIAIMFILLSIVELALPNNNMKRYVNIVIGFMVIIVIISPFVKLLNKNFSIEQEIFKTMVDEVQYQYDEDLALQNLQARQIKETYLKKLKENIKESIDGVLDYQVDDIKIWISEDDENYGEIKDIEIVMGEKKDIDHYEHDSINTIKIEEIKIDTSNFEVEKLEAFEEADKIKNILHEKYSIPRDSIRIFLNNNTEEGEKDGEDDQKN
ncbi:MAG: stage III sporulation protein AF [Tissierellia bacterium]|nr:stage III sporulation protein AF [Tissierellia bacterium]